MGKDTGGKGGVIVNVSSIAGLQAIPNCPIYSTTKHAIIGFSRSFAVSQYKNILPFSIKNYFLFLVSLVSFLTLYSLAT